jgi:hypothetical protein
MKANLRSCFLVAALCLAMSIPGFAGAVLYTNGAPNGTSNDLYIDPYSGYAVSDQFTLSGGLMTGFTVVEWVPYWGGDSTYFRLERWQLGIR